MDKLSNKKSLVLFINNYRYKKKIKIGIETEILWINNIILKLLNNLETYLEKKIISNELYCDKNNKIKNIISILNDISQKLSIRYISYLRSYIIGIKISKIRLNLINIIENIGGCSLSDIIRIYFNCEIKDKYQDNEQNLEIIDILDKYFQCISFDIYQAKENDLGQKNQVDIVSNYKSEFKSDFSFVKYISFSRILSLKLWGIKIYIPFNKKLVVLSGYFNKNNLGQLKYYNIVDQKLKKIKSEVDKIRASSSFKTNFINDLSLINIFLFNATENAKKCSDAYNELKKIRSKDLSQLIKDFVSYDIEKQRNIIRLFILNNKENNNIYIVNILFDIISQNKSLINLVDEIYNSFNYSQQSIISDAKIVSENMTSSFIKYNDDNISLEKKIILLDAPLSVKEKAFDKLKEINNSKSSENNAKAIQYIEGILKIPFGVYKKEEIIVNLEECRVILIELLRNYKNFDTTYDYDSEMVLFKNDMINHKKNIKNNILKISEGSLTKLLNLYTIPKLKDILNIINVKKKGKKDAILKVIVDNIHKFSLEARIKNNMIDDKIPLSLVKEYENFEKRWCKYNNDVSIYLKNINQTLDDAVYGMIEAKLEIKRIIAQWINGNNKGYVIGFEGPPGTGKTTLAKRGIAKCLRDTDGESRPFCFIPLGGSANGSTLEGHNYTYVGSTWGRIVESLMEAKCMNPIIYIDELDKISKTEHGKELIGILIHLTDPSQNEEFMDKYFSGIKIDISKALIIFSYNDADQIDKILLDRIHRIKIKVLNKYDKYSIATKFLIPDICREVGIIPTDIKISDEILYYIIDNYTHEAGVRKLKECLYDIIRDINLNNLTGDINQFPVTVTMDVIKKIFYNKPTVFIKKIQSTPSIGVVNGLYATTSGAGGITKIETYKYLCDTKLKLELTGSQGDVMKESMKVAKTIAWNLLPNTIKQKIREDDAFGLHIHCPEAAMPKDGPSAGIGITISIISLLCNIPVNNKIAVTGEIDLNGNALPIGGLDSKIEGAIAAGITKVICPQKNIEDVEKIKNSKSYIERSKDKKFTIHLINNILEALDIMLMGHDKYSSLFNNYYSLAQSNEQCLLMFKNLCDQSLELICLTDTSDQFKLLYTSKKFNEILGKNYANKSILNLSEKSSEAHLYNVLSDAKNGTQDSCARLKLIDDKSSLHTVLLKTKKIDNIISCTIKLINSN